MEISLEKIELVKDRTGVSYKEAKDALIKADGNVVDAIIMIEDEIDIAPKTKVGEQASQTVERAKEIVKKGNVSKIVVRKGEEIILNIPVSLGIVGAVLIPWTTIIATILAFGAGCTIEVVKDNGDVINVSEKATETFESVKENGSVIADAVIDKGEEAFTQAKSKAQDAVSKARSAVSDDDFIDDDYVNFDDFDDSILEDDVKPDSVLEDEEKSDSVPAGEE